MKKSVYPFLSTQGTSLILAYSPCIDWGIDMKYMMDAQKLAVDSGYWNLYRYDPRKTTPLTLDAKKKKIELEQYLSTENRYSRLVRADNSLARNFQIWFFIFFKNKSVKCQKW